MKLLSINVSLPKEVPYLGETVKTGIFKKPTEGRVVLRRCNLEGDEQADLSVHGGPDKAVYVYPAEHYAYWRDELPGMSLPWGSFGENFTAEGLLEEGVHIGDRFRIGSAEIAVTTPRIPCYKLGIKLGRADIVQRFLASRRTGFYCAVTREGEAGAGDAIAPVQRDEQAMTVAEILCLYVFERDDLEGRERAARLESLPEGWRRHFRERIEGIVR